MSKVRMQAVLTGAPQLVRRVKLMDTRVQERVRAAVKKGTRAVESGAQQRAPKVSGELAQSVRAEFTKDGLTGFVKAGYGKLLRRSKSKTGDQSGRYAKAKGRVEQRRVHLALANNSRQALSVADLGVYAPVVERGDKRRNKPKRPFMAPSMRQETPGIRSDLDRALKRSADEVTR